MADPRITTIAAPASCGRLVSRLESAPSDRVLEQAFAVLSGAADPALLHATARGLARVGVPGLAVRLLQAVGAADLDGSSDGIETGQGGRIDPGTLERRHRANRDRLRREHPETAEAVIAFDDIRGSFDVYETNAGNRIVLARSTDRLDFVFGFADHLAHARALALPESPVGTSYQLTGVPSVPLWRRLLALAGDTGYRPPVDLVETDPRVFAVWLTLHDLDDELPADRLAFFVGADAPERYRAWLIGHRWRLPAAIRLGSDRPGWRAPALDDAFHAPVYDAAGGRIERAVRVQGERYDDASAASWAKRFADAGRAGPPLRVVGFTTRYSTYIQYVMRDLARAFERRGCTFRIVSEPSASCAGVLPAAFMAESAHDLVVLINHMRFEAAEHIHERVPCISWLQDEMPALWSKRAGGSVSPFELVLVGNPWVMTRDFGYPPGHMLPTTNLTCGETYDDTPIADEDLAPWRCDLSYVGHGGAPPEVYVERIAGGCPEIVGRRLQRFAELVAERLASALFVPYFDRLELLLEAETACGGPDASVDERRHLMLPASVRIYDRVVRHQTLQWAGRWATARGRRLSIFGRDWETHPTLAEFARGPVENGAELRCVHQASRINLQINAYQSMHQRLLDAVACGGFVLSRYNPPDFFGRDLAVVAKAIDRHDLRDLPSLIERRNEDRTLDEALRSLEGHGVVTCRGEADPGREREARLIRAFHDRANGDDAQFEALRAIIGAGATRAGDLDGFAGSTFDDEPALHGMLDRLVDDDDARAALAGPLRSAVRSRHTYDGLVERVLERLMQLFEMPA